MKLFSTSRVLFLVAALGAIHSTSAAPSVSAPSPEHDILLTTGWRFIQQDVEKAEQPSLDDSKWTPVQTPHCWNIQPGQEGDKEHFYDGASWYRLHLKPDASLTGKSLFLKFDAAYQTAEVFLNGQPIGCHVGGFSAFCFDVSRSLKPGEDNLLAVKVRFRPLNPSTPLGGDYTKFPGLYREVHLLARESVSISPLDEGSCGVSIRQSDVTNATAKVQVTTTVRNALAEGKPVTVSCRILDAGGVVAQTSSTEKLIPAAGMADAVQELTVNAPHLWSGRVDPYLYQVEVEVAAGGVVVDRLSQPLGLRYFRADPEHGFFLNGKPYPLHGVNRHQDRVNKGWAISRADMEEDLALLTEMGCTAIRLAHYPHSDTFYDLCDKAGVIVWTEIPVTGGAWTPKEGITAAANAAFAIEAETFMENGHRQLREMIKQRTNHPSIVFWGLWNEIGGHKGAEGEFLKQINVEAKQMDPTRLTICANNADNNRIPDVIGRNCYFGWYSGTPEDLAKQLPQLRAKADGRPLIISEYGAGASVHQHQINPTGVSPKTPFHPEEWQAVIHERAWKALHDAPYLSGSFAWVAMDLASILRNEGDHPGRNDKGLITADRTTRKDTFYFYKANWNPEPMVYITSRRFSPRPSGTFPLKIYSSCPEVEVLVNEKSLGARKTSENGVFVWDNVSYPDGEMRVKAMGKRDGKAVEDAIVWTCSPTASHKLDASERTLSTP